ncbi:MAG: PD40 domain-containing protein [Fibrobacteria bacterium]|nr:PD40 domain-containing protein [Fibrobacteria bacterium]
MNLALRTTLALLAVAASSHARFGKNKVQYQTFRWNVISTTHFDIHYAQGGLHLAQRAADSLEPIYQRVHDRTGMTLSDRVPFLVYNSHPRFQQTNVIDQPLEEGIGGFTELFKNRVVVPFDGSYPGFDHVLGHELVHALMFNAFEQDAGSRLAGAMRARFPLWFSEGLAEYATLGWDRASEYWLVDAVTNGYLPPPTVDYQGFMAYRGGQNFLHFLDRSFGEGTVKRLVKAALEDRELESAFRRVVRIDLEDAGELWIRELRSAWWPELGVREQPRNAGRKLTKARQDGSFWNMQPILSPDDSSVAWFSDKGTRQALWTGKVSRLPRKSAREVQSGAGTPSHESFSPFRSGLDWSPDGKRIVVAALRSGRNVLQILDARTGRLRGTIDPKLDALSNPAWSRDGRWIAFHGLLDGRSDLWIADPADGTIRRLTDDAADDDEPSFSPSGRYLAFSSDRAGNGKDIWLLEISNGNLRRLTSDPADDTRPSWGGADDSTALLAFVSDRCGLPQVHAFDSLLLDSTSRPPRPVTNLLSGVASAQLSRSGKHLVLSLFEGGSFDVWLLDARRRLSDSVLPWTRGETSRREASSLFRPVSREYLESFVPDTLPLRVRIDSLRRAGDTAAADSLARSDSALRLDSLESVKVDSLRALRDRERRRLEAERRERRETGDGRLFGPDPLDQAERAPHDRPIKTSDEPEDTSKVFPPQWPLRDDSGNLLSRPYKADWSLDNAAMAVGFSSYAGTAGQGYFTFSDLTGDQTLGFALDLQGTFDNANVQARYGWLPWQTDLYASAFHVRNYTGHFDLLTGDAELWSDRMYGLSTSILHPRSIFHRFQLDLGLSGMERLAMTIDDKGELVEDSTRSADDITTGWARGELSWVFDNVAWGITGPLAGNRTRLSLAALPPWGQERFGFVKAALDSRLYLPTGKLSGFALRLSAGSATGLGARENPLRFLVGGDDFTLNYHVNSANTGTSLGDIYFSELDLPLRGYRYLQFRGTNEALANAEFRFPFVEEIRFGFPFPSLRYLMGAIFLDVGGAWTSGDWRDQIGFGSGYGLRMNLGAIILRWSVAWPLTQPGGHEGNLQPSNPDGAFHYWSLGAEF